MSAGLILACLWAVVANVVAMFPSRRGHWPAAWALIAAGIPILGLVTWQSGPWAGFLVMAAGASMLRWPLRYLVRRLRRMTGV